MVYLDKIKRNYNKITLEDLKTLGKIACKDQDDFFKRNPKYSIFKNKKFAILLVQGAALHYINKKNGINDFDVLVLYEENTKKKNESGKLIKIYPKRLMSYKDKMCNFKSYDYSTRKVDMMMREIPKRFTDNYKFTEAIKQYFKSKMTQSVCKWEKKAGIGIYPKQILGKIIFSA